MAELSMAVRAYGNPSTFLAAPTAGSTLIVGDDVTRRMVAVRTAPRPAARGRHRFTVLYADYGMVTGGVLVRVRRGGNAEVNGAHARRFTSPIIEWHDTDMRDDGNVDGFTAVNDDRGDLRAEWAVRRVARPDPEWDGAYLDADDDLTETLRHDRAIRRVDGEWVVEGDELTDPSDGDRRVELRSRYVRESGRALYDLYGYKDVASYAGPRFDLLMDGDVERLADALRRDKDTASKNVRRWCAARDDRRLREAVLGWWEM